LVAISFGKPPPEHLKESHGAALLQNAKEGVSRLDGIEHVAV